MDMDICYDCLFWSQGYGRTEYADESIEPCGLISEYQVDVVFDDDYGLEESFSWSPCPGCGSELGGARFPVVLTEAPRLFVFG